MKKMHIAIVVLCCALLLVGCRCEHEWIEANCEQSKTCSLCGETEGAPLGHVWMAATCELPQTCQTCGATEGEALGHDWAEATCTAPKTCSRCHTTEGDALGHSWNEATTEAPKTCATCGLTEGERIVTDPRFTTAACQALFGSWTCEYTSNVGEELGISVEGENLEYSTFVRISFSNDGKIDMLFSFDSETFRHVVEIATAELTYVMLEGEGISRADADAALLADSGMTVPEYAASYAASLETEKKGSGVYYVSGDLLYIGDSWDNEIEETSFKLEGDTLTMQVDSTTLTLRREATEG